MKSRILLAGIASLLVVSCNVTAAEPTVTPKPTETPTTIPTKPPTVVTTPTLVDVSLTIKDPLVNCRFGPGKGYELINEIQQGELARVIGRDPSSTWWYIKDPGNPNGTCWVSASVAETQGPADQIPVVQAPLPTVTKVSLRVEPTHIVVNCNQFPQTVFFEATVTVNGPTYMSWKWEVSTGVSSNEGLTVFEEAGTKTLNDYYQVNAPNEYWIQLHILTPNESITQVTFPVNCTP